MFSCLNEKRWPPLGFKFHRLHVALFLLFTHINPNRLQARFESPFCENEDGKSAESVPFYLLCIKTKKKHSCVLSAYLWKFSFYQRKNLNCLHIKGVLTNQKGTLVISATRPFLKLQSVYLPSVERISYSSSQFYLRIWA